jgi:putative lipoic acid-binding regulatory protein
MDEKLYPNRFFYKIIFKTEDFDLEVFLSVLKETLNDEENKEFEYETKMSETGKYVSYTFSFFIKDEKTADILNEKIHKTPGIITYFSAPYPEEK